MPSKKKRIDGIGKLTAEEKRERDARATYWMNQRKIERIAEGAARHGWHRATKEWVEEFDPVNADIDEDGELILTVVDDGRYRVHGYDEQANDYLLRKVESFKQEPADAPQ